MSASEAEAIALQDRSETATETAIDTTTETTTAWETATETATCPECGGPAVVEWRSTGGSTDGSVEHIKVRCPDRHWFLLPASWVGPATA
jgi:rubredoxin